MAWQRSTIKDTSDGGAAASLGRVIAAGPDHRTGTRRSQSVAQSISKLGLPLHGPQNPQEAAAPGSDTADDPNGSGVAKEGLGTNEAEADEELLSNKSARPSSTIQVEVSAAPA